MEGKHVQVLILGAGCAGLTAGIYAARAGAEVLILEHGLPGGQAALTWKIDNYPGLPGIDGVSLMQRMQSQAEACGAKILCTGVLSVEPAQKRVETEAGCFTADALILATGAVQRELGIPGEAEFRGRGVSCCASCDGFFYRGKDIYVIGGGNSAGEEALHLAQIGRRVYLLVRKSELRCDAAIRERVEGVAAYYAAQNITPEGIKEMSDIVDLQEFYFSRKDAAHLHQVDDRFHDAICQLSNRNVLIDTLLPLLRKTRRYRKLSLENWDRTSNTKQEHYAIYQAIVSGNAPLAEELTAKHISNAKAHMMKGMKNNG